MHPPRQNITRLRTLAAAITLCLCLAGCGGPKYSKNFSDWFKMSTAEKFPIKIDDVDVEETAATGNSAIFQFTASGETTEDLYTEEPIFDRAIMADVMKQIEDAKLDGVSESAASAAGMGPILDKCNALGSQRSVVLKIATPKGHEVNFKGKGRATLGNTGWEFATVELSQDPLPGSPQPNGKNFVISGSPEHKKLAASTKAVFDAMKAALKLSRSIYAEEKRVAEAAGAKAEAEARALADKEAADKKTAEKLAREQFLISQNAIIAKLAPGTTYLANWHGANSRGTLGLILGEGVKIANGYSADAILTNTPERTFSKKVCVALTGEGSAEAPFVVEINALKTEKNESFYSHRDSGIGFITGDAHFKLPLEFTSATGNLTGVLQNSYSYGYGPAGPVNFDFKQQDLPSSAPHRTPGETKDAPAKQSSEKPSDRKPLDPTNPFTPEEEASLVQLPGEPSEKELRDRRQSVVDGSRPLYNQVEAAINAKNIQEAARLRDNMVQDFPTSPLTFQARVLMSIEELDLAELDAVLADTQQSPILTRREKALIKKHHVMLKPVIIDEKKKKANLQPKR